MAAYAWLLAVALCLCTYNMGASGMTFDHPFGVRAFHFSATRQQILLAKIHAAAVPSGFTLVTHCQAGGQFNVDLAFNRPRRTPRLRTSALAFSKFSRRRWIRLTGSRYADSLQCRHQSLFYEGAINRLINVCGLTVLEVRYILALPHVPSQLLGALAIEILGVLNAIQNPFVPQTPQISCPSIAQHIRTSDGTCNNLMYPQFGMANAPFQRFIAPMYEDGLGEPRNTSDGIALPNPREISIAIHRAGNDDERDDRLTHVVMQWGQFIDHDLTLSPLATAAEGEGEGEGEGQEPEPLVCCFEDDIDFDPTLSVAEIQALNQEIAAEQPDCIAFALDPENDPAFTPRTCHAQIRSAEARVPVFPSGRCGNTEREQMNVLTAFVDGSMVYGSSEEELFTLRGGSNSVDGLLAEDEVNNQILLPERPAEQECIVENDPRCFLAGDERVNEQPGLTSIHTILLRQHNRIARILKELADPAVLASYATPEALDEGLFQATRKIVIAQIQRITYGEFLPVLLDEDTLCECGLKLAHPNTFFTGYNPKINPGIRNAFGAAAYRLGHSLIREEFSLADRRRDIVSSFNLSQHFEDETITRSVLPNTIISGLTVDEAQPFDSLGSPAVTDRLFQNLDFQMIGMDLFSINIQRGRDHGLPPYVDFRRFCGLSEPTNFDELIDHDPTTRGILADVYADTGVMGIDLWTGGISEMRKSNVSGILGATFACLVARQFKVLKEGDRFYFETNDMDTGFDIDQLNNIRQTGSLGSLLCQNTDLRRVPQTPFFQTDIPAGPNRRVPALVDGKLEFIRNRARACTDERVADLDFTLFPLKPFQEY